MIEQPFLPAYAPEKPNPGEIHSYIQDQRCMQFLCRLYTYAGGAFVDNFGAPHHSPLSSPYPANPSLYKHFLFSFLFCIEFNCESIVLLGILGSCATIRL